MARIATAIYDLLVVEQRPEGYSVNEIVAKVVNKFHLTPGRALKQRVQVALRRGVLYGIVSKHYQRYRFNSGNTPSLRVLMAAKRSRRRKGKSKRRSGKGKGRKRYRAGIRHPGTIPQPRRVANISNSSTYPKVPRPRLPPPPTWAQRRRNLREESVTKIIKHNTKKDE